MKRKWAKIVDGLKHSQSHEEQQLQWKRKIALLLMDKRQSVGMRVKKTEDDFLEVELDWVQRAWRMNGEESSSSIQG